ncbi:hypothetical protein E3P99_02474 [Wallemia hederae]|uniref:Uncharacterized protein n=1 Tax=Wallemia hederae TaxID=1540922 RepID=A0A4T0FME9_9BASI|nr:hypothetical protein E3P99_02474 [Wallemia hederae]
MLHLPDKIQKASEVDRMRTPSPMDTSSGIAMQVEPQSSQGHPHPQASTSSSTTATTRKPAPLHHRIQFHRQRGSLLRAPPPPSQKVDIGRCTSIRILARFDSPTMQKLLGGDMLEEKRASARRRIDELRAREADTIHEDVEQLSLKENEKEKKKKKTHDIDSPVPSKVYMSTNDSVQLQKEVVHRLETQRMMAEMVDSSKKARGEEYAQFDWSGSDSDSDNDNDSDDDDDENWLMPSYSRKRADAAAHHHTGDDLDTQDSLEHQICALGEDELTNAHVDAAGSLLERGDT